MGKRMVYDSNYVVKASGSDYTSVGFTGQRTDVLDSGNKDLSYYKNRWYDAETGRFISHDPLGYLADINMYQYVRSNSIILTDSLGLWDERIHKELTGMLADNAGFGNCLDDIMRGANLPDEDWRQPINATLNYYFASLYNLLHIPGYSDQDLEVLKQLIQEAGT